MGAVRGADRARSQRWSSLEAALVAEARQAAEDTSSPAAAMPPVLEESAAFARFEHLAAMETRPRLRALLEAAQRGRLPYVVDEAELTLGAGAGGRRFPLDRPAGRRRSGVAGTAGHPDRHRDRIQWQDHDGASARRLRAAHGWHAGYNCTDGVFLDDEVLALGDYSGPAGARRVHARTAHPSGHSRNGARWHLAPWNRGVAGGVGLVTNVSADHFGEYGIHDLAGLAEVKLAVAAVVKPGGLLVLNADDANCARRRRPCAALRPLPAARLVFRQRGSGRHCASIARGAAHCGVREAVCICLRRCRARPRR